MATPADANPLQSGEAGGAGKVAAMTTPHDVLVRRPQKKAGGWTPAAFSDASDRITYAISRNPIPWLEEMPRAPWAAHDQHTYDGSCAVCKAGDAPFALRAVIDAVLDAIRADSEIAAALQPAAPGVGE